MLNTFSMSVPTPRYFVALISLLVLLSMSGCVTTERGGIGFEVEKSQALKDTVQLAFSYIRVGNWSAAKRHLKTALALDDNNAEVYEAMALVFQNTGEVELAEENYLRSIKLEPSVSRVRNNYAAFLGQQNRYAEAVVQLQQVVADTLYNNRPSAFVSLGQSQLQLQQLEAAREAFRRAFLMNRNNIPVTFYLAEVNYKLDNLGLAQQYYDSYRAAVKQQPARALWLGIRLAEEFSNNDALASYGMVLKNLYPNSQEYLDYKKVYGL